mgnify:CR=1 FL=1
MEQVNEEKKQSFIAELFEEMNYNNIGYRPRDDWIYVST